MSIECMESTAEFLRNGARELNAKSVSVVLHGGEPLYMPKEHFRQICHALRSRFQKDIKLSIGLQTNAMLVDEEWIEIFHDFEISISVSVDGTQEIHDKFRIDHKGRGTYNDTVKGIRLLQEFAKKEFIPDIGALAVINPKASGKAVYRHLKDDLKFSRFNILLPMDSYETFDTSDIPGYIDYVQSAFEEWVNDDDPDVNVRMFDQFARHIATSYRDLDAGDFYVISISSNGELSGDDDLKELDIDHGYYNIKNITLKSFVNSNLMKYVKKVKETLPEKCYSCDWKNYCRGGAQHGVISNRYSKANGFANHSVICEVLSEMYFSISQYFLNSGLSIESLRDSLAYRRDFGNVGDIKKLPILNDLTFDKSNINIKVIS